MIIFIDSLAIFVFLSTILLCLCTYALYPAAIIIIGKMLRDKTCREDILPGVSIIISAYNEASDIEKKILNTMALDYPDNKMEILIGSDGSTDDTVAIAEKINDPGIRVFDFKENRGKTAVQNDLVNSSDGEILVFTDAASFLPPDALKKLVRNFADNSVGCVAGKMSFIDTSKNLTTQSQGLYWKYEMCIRESESRLGCMIGVDGPLYAVKREYYIPLGHNIISDLITPLLVLYQGKKVILEPEAIVEEEPKLNTSQEFETRRRITLRGLIGISTYKKLLNPFKNPLLAIQIFFHKIIRWFVGPLVILNGISCLMLLEYPFIKFYLVFYILFFVIALIGWWLAATGKNIKGITVPYYFSLVNIAATKGIIDFFKRKQATSWKPVR